MLTFFIFFTLWFNYSKLTSYHLKLILISDNSIFVINVLYSNIKFIFLICLKCNKLAVKFMFYTKYFI